MEEEEEEEEVEDSGQLLPLPLPLPLPLVRRLSVQLFAVVVSKRWLHSTRCARKNRKFQKCGCVNVDGYLSQEATECRKCALGRPSSPGEAKYRTRSDFTTGHIGAYSRSEGLPGILPPRALRAD